MIEREGSDKTSFKKNIPATLFFSIPVSEGRVLQSLFYLQSRHLTSNNSIIWVRIIITHHTYSIEKWSVVCLFEKHKKNDTQDDFHSIL